MEVMSPSMMLLNICRTAWHHIPEDSILHSLCHGNLKFCIVKTARESGNMDVFLRVWTTSRTQSFECFINFENVTIFVEDSAFIALFFILMELCFGILCHEPKLRIINISTHWHLSENICWHVQGLIYLTWYCSLCHPDFSVHEFLVTNQMTYSVLSASFSPGWLFCFLNSSLYLWGKVLDISVIKEKNHKTACIKVKTQDLHKYFQ
jgi:hypothetical protein